MASLSAASEEKVDPNKKRKKKKLKTKKRHS